jgi:hypothetical protein
MTKAEYERLLAAGIIAERSEESVEYGDPPKLGEPLTEAEVVELEDPSGVPRRVKRVVLRRDINGLVVHDASEAAGTCGCRNLIHRDAAIRCVACRMLCCPECERSLGGAVVCTGCWWGCAVRWFLLGRRPVPDAPRPDAPRKR